jgi:hypothetical protein
MVQCQTGELLPEQQGNLTIGITQAKRRRRPYESRGRRGLPGLTGGEGVLVARFDHCAPVVGIEPLRARRPVHIAGKRDIDTVRVQDDAVGMVETRMRCLPAKCSR